VALVPAGCRGLCRRSHAVLWRWSQGAALLSAFLPANSSLRAQLSFNDGIRVTLLGRAAACLGPLLGAPPQAGVLDATTTSVPVVGQHIVSGGRHLPTKVLERPPHAMPPATWQLHGDRSLPGVRIRGTAAEGVFVVSAHALASGESWPARRHGVHSCPRHMYPADARRRCC